jgi:D-sedoheptulose 7-phosphate isomerase
MHQELIEILYHTLWETVHVFFEHRELGHDVGQAGFLYPLSRPGKEQPTGDYSARWRNRFNEGARRREAARAGGRTRIRAIGRLRGHCRARSARRQADHFRQRRVGHRCERLGHRLRLSAAGLSPDSRGLAVAGAGQHQRHRQRRRHRPDFLRQFRAGAPEDVAIGISTSGGSRNIMALEEARKRGMLTVALLGYDGGEILRRGLADFPIVVHCDYIPRIQEVQASIYHVMRESLEVLAPWLSLNFSAPRVVPTRERCASGSNGEGTEFVEYDVEADPVARERMRELSGGQRTVPILVDGGKVCKASDFGLSFSVWRPSTASPDGF